MKILSLSCAIVTLLGFSFLDAITLKEAVKLAHQKNKSYLSSKLDAKQGKHNSYSALGNLLPKVTLSSTLVHIDSDTFSKMQMGYDYSYTRYLAETNLGIPSKPPDDVFQNSYTTQLVVSQPIWNGGSIWLGYKQAQEAYKLSEMKLKVDSLDLEYKIAELYFSILKFKELLKVNEQSLKSSISNLKTIENQSIAGIAKESDLQQYKVKVLEKENDLLQVKNSSSILRCSWMNTLGLKPADILPEPDAFNFSEYEDEVEYLSRLNTEQIEAEWLKKKETVLKSNEKIKMLDRTINISKLAYMSSLGNFSPSLNLTWTKTIEDDEKLDFKGGGSSILAVNLSIPLFKGTSRIWNTSKAKTALDQAEINKADGESGILLAAQSSFYAMVTNAKKIRIYSESLKSAKIQYNQIKNNYDAGLTDATSLIDADLILYSSEMQLTSARYDFILAKLSFYQFLNQGVE
ncbi:MAG: TolC family protein [Candidatus Coatesbacteria bacterium]|nr:TolC family protein [Candidatus Coatesbacteria bacterium]